MPQSNCVGSTEITSFSHQFGVFIYQNNIHIISPNILDIDTELNMIDAINIIINNQVETKSLEVQQAILNRIGNYPEKMTENIHRALVKLPLDVATLLTLKPSFISPIVSSYCEHDMLEARVCKNVTFKNCITVQVKFTKCLYAMLTHSKLITNLKNAHVDLNDKKRNLGLKLTCGYEIIMSKLKVDIISSKEYTKFIKSLSDKGYFRDSIEGSKEHTRLLEKAKEFYLNMECPVNSQLNNAIAQIMHTEEFITLKESLKNTQGLEKELAEDNDDWLNIQPDELNNLLNTRYGKKPTFKKDDVMNSETITSKLSNFLKETSDFEGIEIGYEEEEDTEINFDSDIFVNSLKNMLDTINGADEVDSDNDSNNDMDDVSPEDNIDEEIRRKLLSNISNTSEDSQNIISNMIQSMKEEQGAPGPISNLLRAIGINKTSVLDSDDDDDDQ
ncbi:protein ecdysoneless [Hyposmocoma kahamanoa]|uniref:protein ecdysoneless n=1 Tax=Hyposmocoma kahamanoa TaxID=1477025 RepID=UPI000E6D7497|nr:protein ecdysoneless [Hyposmocoma kahamanoa]